MDCVQETLTSSTIHTLVCCSNWEKFILEEFGMFWRSHPCVSRTLFCVVVDKRCYSECMIKLRKYGNIDSTNLSSMQSDYPPWFQHMIFVNIFWPCNAISALNNIPVYELPLYSVITISAVYVVFYCYTVYSQWIMLDQ